MALFLVTTVLGVDMLAGRSPAVTVDGVMGGRSNAQGTVDSTQSISFQGRVNTNGGGFAYITLSGGLSMDLSGATGIYLAFDSMDIATYGSAPIAFKITLESRRRCAMAAAFAVPTTASVERTHAWVPLRQFQPEGNHWDYSSRRAGIPSYCTASATTTMADVASFALGCYYQNTPFRLVLHTVESRTAAPAEAFLVSPPADNLIARALERARSLVGYAGAGVGAEQMDAMAAATLTTAALQSGDAQAISVARTIATASAAERVAALLTAVGGASLTVTTGVVAGHSPSPLPASPASYSTSGSPPHLPPTPMIASPSSSPPVSLGPAAIAGLCGSGALVVLAALACALVWRRRRSNRAAGRLVPEESSRNKGRRAADPDAVPVTPSAAATL